MSPDAQFTPLEVTQTTRPKFISMILGGIVVVVVLFFIVSRFFTTIPAGHMGVGTLFGKVQSDIYGDAHQRQCPA
jgi:hypothetical protein